MCCVVGVRFPSHSALNSFINSVLLVVSFASENMYTLTYEHYKAFSFSRVVSAVMYDSVIVRNKNDS